MKLPGALKYLTFTMVMLGSLCLLLTLQDIQFVSGDMIILITMIFLGGLYFWETKLHTKAYSVAWNLFTIIYVLYLFFNFQARNLIVSAAYLSVFLQIFKCYNRKTNKDYVQMYLISFFQFVSCAGITSSPKFFVMFVVYMFTAFWGLITFQMKRRLEKYSVAQYSDDEGKRYLVAGGLMAPEDIEEVNIYRKQTLRGVVTPGFLGGTFIMGVIILVSGLVLFYILPRPTEAGGPAFLPSIGQGIGGDKLTGLSDEVDLSTGGKIIEDNSLVMKIKPAEEIDVPQMVLWRAGALNNFDGKQWNNTVVSGQILKPGVDGIKVLQPGFFKKEIKSANDLYRTVGLVTYQVFVENTAMEKVVSAFSMPVALAEVDGRIVVKGNDSYLIRPSGISYKRYSYTVLSEKYLPTVKELRENLWYRSLGRRDKRLYVDMPEVPPSVDEALSRIRIETYRNNYDKAVAIQKYLESTCTYTTDVKRTPKIDSPVEDFLVHTKSGHCELFATAMAVMCRKAGIPARLAYGYKTSEWNEYGQFYQVRQRDAHAWVEIYFPTIQKWVHFDPSPISDSASSGIGFFKNTFRHLGRFIEAMKTKWYDSVVFYNLSKQKQLARSILRKLMVWIIKIDKVVNRVKERVLTVWSWLSESRVTAAIALISIGSVTAAGILLIRRKLITHKRFKKSYQDGISRRYYHKVRFYEKMLKILMGIEIIKPENMTPMEFAHQLENKDSRFSGVRYVTELYYSVRFGSAQPEFAEIRVVAEVLSRLRKTSFLRR